MESDRYHYVKVAGSKPETFQKVWLQDGVLVKTEDPLTEVELRQILAKDGRSMADIEDIILAARENAA